MLFDPTKAQVVHASTLAKIEVNEDSFLIKPRFLPREGRLMIAGDTEAGKSWICLSMIRALTLGEPMLGNPDWVCTKSRVLYIESEVKITVPERIRLVFGDVKIEETGFYGLVIPEGFNLSYESCLDWIHEQIKTYKFDVVVVDPLGDLTLHDEKDNSEVNRALHKLKAACGVSSMIFSLHTGKPPKGEGLKNYDPLDLNNVRGASKYKGSIDTALMVNRRPGRLVQHREEESWVLDARWAKIRHLTKNRPPQAFLKFNEALDGRMIWTEDDPALAPLPVTATLPWG